MARHLFAHAGADAKRAHLFPCNCLFRCQPQGSFARTGVAAATVGVPAIEREQIRPLCVPAQHLIQNNQVRVRKKVSLRNLNLLIVKRIGLFGKSKVSLDERPVERAGSLSICARLRV